ncbi:MAG: hypothetical protein U0R19_24795 [Bryobacteraceae bacterium]
MAKPQSLLDRLCIHALSFDAQSLSVNYDEGYEHVFARLGDRSIQTARFPVSSSDAQELRQNLEDAARKPTRKVLDGQTRILKVRTHDDFGETGYEVTFKLVAPLDASVPPKYTQKQGQYLAYLHYFTKIHHLPPAESDFQRYFGVSAPAVHDMLVILQRNGFIERTPGQARSSRLLVKPEHLPPLK